MLTRRSLIQSGAAAAIVGLAGPAIAAPAEAPGISAGLIDRAFAALDEKRRFLRSADLIAVADFARPSREARLYLIQPENGRITRYCVSHGRGSDPDHTGYVNLFSNRPGSAASSAGAYVTGELYHGKYGRSMRLRGLDHSNSNAEARGIVVHSAPYAEPEIIDRYGKLGRSEGCFALSELDLFLVLRQLGPGRLLYCDKL